jgi:hypothetical protein
MKPTTLSRAELVRALELVKPGLSLKGAGRVTTEQSNLYAFKGGRVYAFNGEACGRCPTGLPEDFVTAVPGDILGAALEKMDDEEVEVSGGGAVFRLRGRSAELEIASQADIEMPLSRVTKPGPWARVPEEFAEALEMAAEVTSKDDTRVQLNSVNVCPGWVEATDHWRMLRYEVKTGVPEPALIQRNAVLTAAALDIRAVALSDGWVHFRGASGNVLSCKRHDENYPPDLIGHFGLDAFQGERTTVPKGLVRQGDLAEVFVGPDHQGGLVTVRIRDGRITVRGDGPFGRLRTRPRKVSYAGPPVTFRMGPRALAAVSRMSNDLEISGDRLRVRGGGWVFFTKVEAEGLNGRGD